MTDRFEIDEAAFNRNERRLAYALGNALLLSHLSLQRHYGLRAETFQVLLVIILATVQRLLRSGATEAELMGTAPLPEAQRVGISRRRIAEVLDIPFETVRRHVELLAERGLVEERRRGQISTRGGTLRDLSEAGLTLGTARQFLGVFNDPGQDGVVIVRPVRARQGGRSG